jgi:hypothetical protein
VTRFEPIDPARSACQERMLARCGFSSDHVRIAAGVQEQFYERAAILVPKGSRHSAEPVFVGTNAIAYLDALDFCRTIGRRDQGAGDETAAVSRLIFLAVIVAEPPRGSVVPKAIDLSHVLGGDNAGKLGSLACRATCETSREIHDETLKTRPFDLAHDCAFAREDAGELKA